MIVQLFLSARKAEEREQVFPLRTASSFPRKPLIPSTCFFSVLSVRALDPISRLSLPVSVAKRSSHSADVTRGKNIAILSGLLKNSGEKSEGIKPQRQSSVSIAIIGSFCAVEQEKEREKGLVLHLVIDLRWRIN